MAKGSEKNDMVAFAFVKSDPNKSKLLCDNILHHQMTIQNDEPLEDFQAGGKTLNRKTWQM